MTDPIPTRRDAPPPAPLATPVAYLDYEEERSGVSLLGMLNLLMRHARLLVGLPLLAFVGATLLALGGEREFVAESQFMPSENDGAGSSGGGLAAQLALMGFGRRGDAGNLPTFYAALAASTPLMRRAAASEYEFVHRGDTLRGTLADLYGVEAATPKAELNQSLNILKGRLRTDLEEGTGLVVLITRARWPGLATAINDRMLELLNEFNVGLQQSRAAQERAFVEERRAEARRELHAVEAQMEDFLESNLRYRDSPRLLAQAGRLERELQFRLGVYTSLAQAYEQAKIAEIRNTPVINVVVRGAETVRLESATSPYRRGLFGAVVGLVLAMGIVFARYYLARQSEAHPEEFEEFQKLSRSAAGSLVPAGVMDRVRRKGSSNGRHAPDEALTYSDGTTRDGPRREY